MALRSKKKSIYQKLRAAISGGVRATANPDRALTLLVYGTSAVDDGDDFIINGQKIWTSGANHADWMFCLVRTDFDAPKHEGISFVLFDMTTPGVTVKPIKLISGLSPIL
jgi:alkylation response protein AidB-like acyl-CoA dehydrogenase